MFNTTSNNRGFAGIYKIIPNLIIGTDAKIDELLEWYYSLFVSILTF